METFIELLKLTLPAAIMLYAVYLVVKAFLGRQVDTALALMQAETLKRDREQFGMMKIQAYERLAILLERIIPSNLVVRLNDNSMNVAVLQSLMLEAVREEFNYNLSQQIFISDETWDVIKKAKEETIGLINEASRDLDPEAPSLVLAKQIFERQMNAEADPVAIALVVLKAEARKLMR